MESILIRSITDLERLPTATWHPVHIGEDSEEPVEVRAVVARLLAIWLGEPLEKVAPEAAEQLPQVFREMMSLLDGRGFDLWAGVMEPGVHQVTNTFAEGRLVQVMPETAVRIRFAIRRREIVKVGR